MQLEQGSRDNFFWVLTGLLLATFAWLTYAPLDIVSEASGEVVPSTQLKEVQHLEGGIIEKIVVKEGDVVEQNQELVVLKAIASEADVKELQTRIKHAEENLVLINEQIQMSEDLLKDELTNRYNHLTLLREANSLKSRLSEDRFKLDKLRDNLDRTSIKSPVSGVIKSILLDTQGGVVKPGETIVEIVPVNDRLIIEAQLPFYDVGYVKHDQQAKVRLASADASRFPPLKGKVVNISPDTTIPDEGNPYYLIRIEVESDAFVKGNESYELVPGMQMQVGVLTGQRTVLEYLLTPFISSLGSALGER